MNNNFMKKKKRQIPRTRRVNKRVEALAATTNKKTNQIYQIP
jgi:hypothetical protein